MALNLQIMSVYDPDYFQKTKDKYLKRHKKNKQRLKEMVDKLKELPCTDCGQTFPTECMDFDHRDPEEKSDNVGTMVSNGQGTQRILDEIKKCDLVCANCHRIRTHRRQMANR